MGEVPKSVFNDFVDAIKPVVGSLPLPRMGNAMLHICKLMTRLIRQGRLCVDGCFFGAVDIFALMCSDHTRGKVLVKNLPMKAAIGR
jgi:hypothetical protein